MVIKDNEFVDIPTPAGPMRTYVLYPVAEGRYPGVAFFSEIFQVTGPIRRSAAVLAGHGFVVAIPEIFHELEEPGTVLPYDQAGADRGNAGKIDKGSSDDRAFSSRRSHGQEENRTNPHFMVVTVHKPRAWSLIMSWFCRWTGMSIHETRKAAKRLYVALRRARRSIHLVMSSDSPSPHLG